MNAIGQSFNPMIQRGYAADAMADQNYQNFLKQQQGLINNPNALQDSITKGFSVSPYQQSLLDTTTKQMNMNAANTGMIQSPVAQQALNSKLNTMTGQFMNDYINRGMATYNQGLNGYSTLNNMLNLDRTQGYGALQDKESAEGQQAGAQLQGDISQQNAYNNMFGDALSGLSGGLGGGSGFNWSGFLGGL